MIRAIIVDDEELARDEMRFLLEGEEVEVVGEASGGGEALELALEAEPDLIFLDIQMPEMNGFQVLQALLRSGREVPLIIFATAYDQYAIKAFEFNALDYLLKPIEKKRLHEALERARRSLPKRGEFTERLRKLAGSINITTPFLPRIVIQRGTDVALIECDTIAMLGREGKLVKAYTSEGVFATNYTGLDELETQLDPRAFLRLGADHIINIERISEVLPWAGGKYIVLLDDADRTEVKLTRSQAMLLKSKMEGAT